MTAHAHRSLVRRATAAAAAVTAVIVLAACGAGDDKSADHDGHGRTARPSASAPASQGQHNAADVSFAQRMIPHHRQAVEMAGLATTRAESAEVRKLAAEIKKAQDPEIKALSGWLTSWGEEVPAEGAMDHSVHDTGGMMTAEEMDKLEKSSGRPFDAAFMELMIKHHRGAVEMARTEQTDGTYQPAKDMAGAVITSQTAEITRMSELLGKS
ncbi:DUF305 domain-containing protein [Streptomyces sp. NPDC057445]|uniref:DUF305 domain-containing protein n=1 Tax=Streptomyces sp. NPDC057445 TaxID=3346136 RepID=UPI0036A37D1F